MTTTVHHLAAALTLAAIGVATGAQAAEVQVEGWYRARARAYDTLSLDRANTNSEGLAAYGQHRFWLKPKFLVSDRLGVFAEIKGLDGVLWGDRSFVWSDPSTSDPTYGLFEDSLADPLSSGDATPANLTLWRVWAELHTDIGRFRVGRVPLQWGMGAWQNDGLGLNAEYGDTADRIQWEREFQGFFARIAIDVSSETLLNASDDVTSFNGALAVRREALDIGLNAQLRHRGGTNAYDLVTADLAADLELGPLHARVEGLVHFGSGDLDDDFNDVQVLSVGAAADVSLNADKWDFGILGGVATGDGNTADAKLRTFTFDRDFNVGLVMFEQPMPRLATAAGGLDLDLAVSGPAVSNALFIKPSVSRTLIDGLKVHGSLLAARAATLPDTAQDRMGYGVEIGAGASWSGFDHVDVSVDGAVFLPGTYYRNASTEFDFGGPVWAGQVITRFRF